MTAYPSFVPPATAKWCARSGLKHGHAITLPAAPGTLLCSRCHNRFATLLAGLVHSWPILQQSVMRASSRVYRERVGGGDGGASSDAGTFWNPAATQVLRDITEWTGSLVRAVHHDRADIDRWVWPEPFLRSTDPTSSGRYTRPQLPAADTLAALAWLQRWHSHWLSYHPADGADWLDDIQRLSFGTNRALESRPVQRITLPNARCQRTLEETDLGPILCEGQLVAVVPPPGDDTDTQVLCALNPSHLVHSSEWIRLDLTR